MIGLHSAPEEGELKFDAAIREIRELRDKLWAAYYSKNNMCEMEIRQLEVDLAEAEERNKEYLSFPRQDNQN